MGVWYHFRGGLKFADEYSCAGKPRFRNVGNRHSRNGKPQLLLGQ